MRLADRGTSCAVLIGTSKYDDAFLPNISVVPNTINDLAGTLTDRFSGVLTRESCTILLDERNLPAIGRHLRSAAGKAKDLFLVFYTGHGLVGGRRHELYLGLPESEWASPEFGSLEYDKLRNVVLESPAANKVIILDCCFSGRVVTDTMADPIAEVIGQIEVDGTCVLTSAQRDELALVLPDEQHTAFTGRLVHLLRQGVVDGPEYLTIDYLYQYLSETMKAAGLSRPQMRGTSTARMLGLARNRAAARLRDYRYSLYRPPELSKREYEVAEHIAKGESNRAIADKLGISPRTVESHIAKIRQKLWDYGDQGEWLSRTGIAVWFVEERHRKQS